MSTPLADIQCILFSYSSSKLCYRKWALPWMLRHGTPTRTRVWQWARGHPDPGDDPELGRDIPVECGGDFASLSLRITSAGHRIVHYCSS